MIQLPSKIRTTLFTVSVENEPMQLFSHEAERIVAILYVGNNATIRMAFGRSAQDVRNSADLSPYYPDPIYFYGPEPLWMGIPNSVSPNNNGVILIHGVYYA